MKVDAITGYKFNNNNNVDFAGKKSKTQQPQHTTSPMKAVPVIVLMAMSPLNAPVTNARPVASAAPQTEMTTKQEKVVLSEVIEEAFPDGNSCRVDAISTDGDDTNFECIRIVKQEYTKNGFVETMIYPKRLDMYCIKDGYSKRVLETGFCVYGRGVIKTSKGTINLDEHGLTIRERFYDDIKALLGNSIKYTETITEI